MGSSENLAKLKPLFVGRVTRVLAGLAVLVGAIWFVEWQGAAILGGVALVLLGLSFLVGGLVGNPGCEVTSLPNLVLPSAKRVHCT